MFSVKFFLLHHAKFPHIQLIYHKFLKDDFSRSNQRESTKRQDDHQRSRISQTSLRFSLLIDIMKDNFASNKFIFLSTRLPSALKLSLKSLGKNWINLKDFIAYTQIILSCNSKFTTSMLYCPSTKQFCLPFCIVKCTFLSDWVTAANPQSFVWFYKLLDFRTAMIIQLFYLFNNWTAQKLSFFFPFWKVFSLSMFRKVNFEVTVIQTCTVQHNSMQFSCTSKSFLCWLVSFCLDEKEYLWRFLKKITPSSLITFISANLISSKM